MSKPTVILLSGKSGNGKDFAANILKEQLEACNKKVLVTHYADLLKYICKTFFNWDGQKDEFGRSLLQHIGTDIVRKKNPDEWDYVLIPDTRFLNEIKTMEYHCKYLDINVFTIRINRPHYKSNLTKEQQEHPSETALDVYGFDYYINNKSKEMVEVQIDDFIKTFLNINIKPTCFIDLDCTVYNTIAAIVDMYDEDFCYYSDYKKINWKDVVSWNFEELKAAPTKHIDHYFNQKRFFDKVEMFNDAKNVIDKLSEKYNIKFVSLGYTPNLKLKAEWVKDNFSYAEFIGVDMKDYKDKSHINMSGEGNVFIDDRADNLETSNADIKICFGECYDWNKDWDTDEVNKFDAFNWTGIEWLFNEFNKKISQT